MWQQTDCVGYLKTASVLAAYVDQSISTNTFYNPAYFEANKVPSTLIAKNLMQAHRWGLKTFYYSLINKAGAKSASDVIQQLELESVEPKEKVNGHHEIELDFDDDCEACKL